jgi:para-nitrobenzyl esterase
MSSQSLTSAIVRTQTGPVRGKVREHDVAYLGIPFAAAPIHDFRFLAPQPVDTWSDVRDCVEFGPTTLRQSPYLPMGVPIPGDETLNLNVFTPIDAVEGADLPVIVWIYGGAFIGGSASTPLYDGGTFTNSGIVFVSITHRLGFDGFGAIDGAPANRGVRDQVAGLEWVRDNIRAFGGDPAKVTIWGQSSGGCSVIRLLSFPRAQGLFRSAIAGSPGIVEVEPADAAEYAQTIGRHLGITPDVESLRAVPELDVLAAQFEAFPAESPFETAVRMSTGVPQRYGPVIDGEYLVAGYKDALLAGTGADIPLLLGATRDEFTARIPGAEPMAGMPLEDSLRLAGFDEVTLADYTARFPGRSAAWIAGHRMGDRIFRGFTGWIMEARARVATAPTWGYDFAWSPAEWEYGATHGMDVALFFDAVEVGADVRNPGLLEAPDALVTRMHGDIVEFVKTSAVAWPTYDAHDRSVRVYDAEVLLAQDPYRHER